MSQNSFDGWAFLYYLTANTWTFGLYNFQNIIDASNKQPTQIRGLCGETESKMSQGQKKGNFYREGKEIASN